MIIQLIEINIPYVFKRYVKKYNIYRDLYEIDLLALEIREFDEELAEGTRHIIFRNKEICYVTKTENEKKVDLLILGSFAIFKEIAKDITAVGNEDLGHKITTLLDIFSGKSKHQISLKKKKIPFEQPIIMGIINVTPDSFSDGGQFFDKEKAIEHGLKLLSDGAGVLDIGGESTRPGSEPVDESEEINRVVPVIEGILKHMPDALISIDTTKSSVAKAAIDSGAMIINDISAMTFDKNMVKIAAEKKAAIILMHMKGTPQTMQKHPYYDDVILEIYDYLHQRIKFAEQNGVEKVIIDPGIGFGKRVEDNYEILRRLNEFKGLHKPIAIGVSRKSFLGKSLDLEIENRKEATLAAETMAIKNGADFIRTHDVAQTVTASKFIKQFNGEITV